MEKSNIEASFYLKSGLFSGFSLTDKIFFCLRKNWYLRSFEMQNF